MDTKEAIEFLKAQIKCLEEEIEICNPDDDMDIQIIPTNKKLIIKANQIIFLLQQGKKWKAIVEELSRILPKPHYIYKNCNGKVFEYYCNANAIEALNSIKKKYFLKEV